MNTIIHHNTGLRLSQFGFGNWLTSTKFDNSDFTQAIKLLHNDEINWIDTADSYDSGIAEERLEKCLTLSGLKSNFFISTKVFFPSSHPNHLDETLCRKKIFNAIDASIRRLRVNQLDLVYLHRDDLETPVNDIAITMDMLCRQGKIIYWGVSRWSTERLNELVDYCRKYSLQAPTFYQDVYNIINRDYCFKSFRDANLSFIGYSILARGVLTNKYQWGYSSPNNSRLREHPHFVYDYTPEKLRLVNKISLLAKQFKISTVDAVFNFYKSNREIQGYLFGASNLEQVKSNLYSICNEKNIDRDFFINLNSIINHEL